MTWTCSECRVTVEYKPSFDDDFPDGWFGIENDAWSSPCCSAKCARALLANYEEPQAVDAVDPHVADPGTLTPRDAKCSHCNDLHVTLAERAQEIESLKSQGITFFNKFTDAVRELVPSSNLMSFTGPRLAKWAIQYQQHQIVALTARAEAAEAALRRIVNISPDCGCRDDNCAKDIAQIALKATAEAG